MPKFGRKVPHLRCYSHIYILVSRSNGRRTMLEYGHLVGAPTSCPWLEAVGAYRVGRTRRPHFLFLIFILSTLSPVSVTCRVTCRKTLSNAFTVKQRHVSEVWTDFRVFWRHVERSWIFARQKRWSFNCLYPRGRWMEQLIIVIAVVRAHLTKVMIRLHVIALDVPK